MCIPLNPLKSSGAEVGLHFMDEPTNGLDEAGVKEIRQLIEQEKERGALILLASHNQEDMKILADQVYKIADGRIERKGTEL